MGDKSAVHCQADGCHQILAERLGALWLIKARGRDVVAVGVLTMRCPRCHAAWRNPELAVFDGALTPIGELLPPVAGTAA